MTAISKITTAITPLEEVDKINEIVEEINNPSLVANKDLSNLSSTGKNISNWSSNVSNCITEMPQNIKLEFDTSTKVLTLKSGSKLYIPNGSGVFDEVTISSDQTLTNNFSGQYNNIAVFWDSANNILRQTPTVNSGSSDPSTASNRVWFDTTNNKIKYYSSSGTTLTSDSLSFPFCIMANAGSGNGFTKVQQVFQGIGYIGSTVFALPGIKCLVPNGRNEDGSLKNTLITSSVVRTITATGTHNDWNIVLNESNMWSGVYTYNNEENQNYSSSGNPVGRCIVAKFSVSNGYILSLKAKTVFHAVDYSDKGTIAGWSAPSGTYIDLTLGASGSAYTAPANGYVVLDKVNGTGASRLAQLSNSTNGLKTISFAPYSSNPSMVFLPVRKGDTFYANYDSTGDTRIFRFIYAQGEV